MERLGMRSGGRASDDGRARGDQDEGVPPLPTDEPDHRPERSKGPGVVDPWFFLGW